MLNSFGGSKKYYSEFDFAEETAEEFCEFYEIPRTVAHNNRQKLKKTEEKSSNYGLNANND